jgi:hypothetical protein
MALLTTAAIVALYFLKHRRRRLVISSALLWKRVLAKHLENSLFERLRRILSILIAVAIGLLVALSIAQPEIEWLTGKTTRTIIVMDTSPSMQARRSDGRTRWQHAVDDAISLVNSGSVRNQFRIVDTAGQFDSSFTTDRKELRRMIAGMHPVNTATRFPHMETPATKSQDAPQIYLITDGVSPLGVPAGVSSISEFQAASNVGITAFEGSVPSAVLAYSVSGVTNFGIAALSTSRQWCGTATAESKRRDEPRLQRIDNVSNSRWRRHGHPSYPITTRSHRTTWPTYLPVKRRAKTHWSRQNKFLSR